MAVTSPGAPKTVICFTDQSADETLGPWVDVRGYAYVAFYCSSKNTTSSGVITFEEASPVVAADNAPVFGASSGNYSAITTLNASTFTGGAQVGVHLAEAAYAFVRPRISTAIGGGGSVTVVLVAY